MKHKQIKFNMSLAKLINSGSVRGGVNMFNAAGDTLLGKAVFSHNNPYGDVFTIIPNHKTDDIDFNPYLVCFNKKGKSIGEFDRNKFQLIIDIPVDDSYDEDVVDTVEQEKDVHYHKCKIEPIEYILANNLDFCEGNIVKYITRYKDKGKPLDDLRKIKVYVDYLIDDLTKAD